MGQVWISDIGIVAMAGLLYLWGRFSHPRKSVRAYVRVDALGVPYPGLRSRASRGDDGGRGEDAWKGVGLRKRSSLGGAGGEGAADVGEVG